MEQPLWQPSPERIADANRLIRDFPEAGIQVLNGRYGPYVTDKKKNAKIPKDKTPSALTLEDCQALLAAAPERRARGGRGAKKKTTTAEQAAPPQAAAKKAPRKAAAKKTKKKAGGKKAKTKRSAAAKDDAAEGDAD